MRRSRGDAKSPVINIKTVRDDGVVGYVTKQILEWGHSDRIEPGSYRRLLDEKNKTNEG